jgi:hypothetical protein
VAITIFSLVVGMAMFSMRYAFGVFRHLDAPFVEETRRVTGLRDCIASTFVYVGERTDMFNRNKEFYTFFNGEIDRMTFVSTKPVALAGPALCRLSVRDKALVLEEVPLYAPDQNYLDPTMESKDRRETVLFSEVGAVKFDYYQGDKVSQSIKEDLPTLVKISLKIDDKEREIFCRLQTDFQDKQIMVKTAHDQK